MKLDEEDGVSETVQKQRDVLCYISLPCATIHNISYSLSRESSLSVECKRCVLTPRRLSAWLHVATAAPVAILPVLQVRPRSRQLGGSQGKRIWLLANHSCKNACKVPNVKSTFNQNLTKTLT